MIIKAMSPVDGYGMFFPSSSTILTHYLHRFACKVWPSKTSETFLKDAYKDA